MSRFTSATCRLIGSGAVTVSILGTLAVALVAAAGQDAQGRFRAPADSLYSSTWFLALLFLLGLGVLAALPARWPWKKRHAGFVVAHVAVLLLLSGLALTSFRGVDGTLSLAEGASSGQVDLASRLLRVDDLPAVAARTGAEVRLPDPATIRVIHTVPSVARSTTVRTDGTAENPAIHFKLKKQQSSVDGWLLSRDADRSQISYGPMTLRFAEIAALPPNVDKPLLYLQFGARQVTMVARPKEERAIDGTPFRVRIVEVLERAVVQKKGVAEQAGADINPAVKFEVVSDRGAETHVAFANFPQFPTLVGKGATQSGVKARYETLNSRSPLLTFFRRPDQSMVLRIRNLDFPCKVGHEIPTPWGLSVTVDQVADKARVVPSFQPAPEGPPALLVALGQEDAWVALGEEITLGGHRVRYEANRADLGFSVQLDRLLVRTDPDTGRPAAWASDIRITDGGTATTLRVPSNQAVSHGAYSFCQAGHESLRGKPAVSILHVTRDAGALPKMAGAVLLVVAFLSSALGLGARTAAQGSGAETSEAVEVQRDESPSPSSVTVACAVLLVLAFAPSTLHAAPSPAAPAPAPAGSPVPSSDPPSAHASPGPATGPAMPAPAGGPHGMPQGHHPGMPPADGAASPAVPPAGALPQRNGLDMAPARRLVVQVNGRIRTLDSLAREAVLDVTGRERYDDRDPVDLALSWTVDSAAWSQRDVIVVPNPELKRALKLAPDQARFSIQVLMGSETLRSLAQAARARGAHAGPLEREALATMARVSILGAFVSGRALALIPPSPGEDASWMGPADVNAADPATVVVLMRFLTAYQAGEPRAFAEASAALEKAMREKGGAAYPSPRQVDLDLRFNRVRPYPIAAVAYGVAVLLLLVGSRVPVVGSLGLLALVLGIAIQGAGMGVRTLVDGCAPLTTLPEAVIAAAWGAAVVALLVGWRCRTRVVAGAGAAIAGGLLGVALLPLSALDPGLRPLVPALALNSWALAHVFLVGVAYATLAVGAALAHAWLVARRVGASDAASDPLFRSLMAVLAVGLLCLACGLVVGGGLFPIDARGALDRGDARDVWALAVLLAYVAAWHASRLGSLAPRGLAVSSVLAFLLVIAASLATFSFPGPLLGGTALGAGGRMALLFAAGEAIFLLLTTRKRPDKGTVRA